MIKTFAETYSPKVVWIKTKKMFVNFDLRSTSLMRQPFNLRSTPTLYNRIDFEISCLCSISMIVRNLVVFRLCAFILNGNAESDVSQMCTTLVCNARHAEDTLRTFMTLDHERMGDKSVQNHGH